MRIKMLHSPHTLKKRERWIPLESFVHDPHTTYYQRREFFFQNFLVILKHSLQNFKLSFSLSIILPLLSLSLYLSLSLIIFFLLWAIINCATPMITVEFITMMYHINLLATGITHLYNWLFPRSIEETFLRESSASELLQNLVDRLPLYHGDTCNRFKSSLTLISVSPCAY